MKWVVFCSVGRIGPSPAFAALPQFGSSPSTQFVERTPHSSDFRLFHDVGVDHGGRDIVVAQKLLHRADVIATLEQMGGKAVAQGVAAARSRGP